MVSVKRIDVTVIICTRDRAESLRATLRSLENLNIPDSWTVELIVVDNASSDHTHDVIANADLSRLQVRTLTEEREGVSHARNAALKAARGRVLVFTDDDVRVPSDWITGMAGPIRAGEADVVAGAVTLAPHLQRDWQASDPWLTTPLATTDVLDDREPERLVGANMAMARSVFDRVPSFNTNLGPGSELSLGEETLLTLQLKDHGLRIASAFDVVVEHHCDVHRLSRVSYLDAARDIGRSQGYIDYHWKCAKARPLRLVCELSLFYAKLIVGRVLRNREIQASEGIPGWEMALLTQIYHRRQILQEYASVRECEA